MPFPSFPKDFLFGAATASHQIEGGQHNDWSEWEKENAARLAKESERAFASWNPHWRTFKGEATKPQNYLSGQACDHWNRYEEDFGILSDLSLGAYRFSLEWSRIEPEKGRFDTAALDRYRDMVRSLREKGIVPFVTLWHWTLPLWLRDEGGLLSPEFAHAFERYAEKVAKTLGKDVSFFITLNEPDVVSSHAYLKGAWPPQKKNFFSWLRANWHLVQAHRKAYRVLKGFGGDLQVGIAKHQVYFETASPTLWNRFLKKAADYAWNHWWLERLRGYQDFIGVNHYNRNVISGWYGKNPNQAQTDIGWEYWPESLEHVLLELRRYRLPLYVTENGLADATDRLRPDFIPRALSAAHRALAGGADLRGYFHWSLLDNFEWDKGFWPRFGLVEVDFATQKRTVRESGRLYARIAADNGLEKPS
jgi:beta-glucosidase